MYQYVSLENSSYHTSIPLIRTITHQKKGQKKWPKKSNCEGEQNNAHICLVVYSSIIQCVSQNLDPIEYMKQ